jgi:hypothetical protein
MDNQQAIEIVAGLFLGEGHFTLGKTVNGKNIILTPDVGFTNSDPALIHYICDWLDSLELHFHMHMNHPKSYRAGNCWTIQIRRLECAKKILNVLLPHLFGQKLHQAALVLRFVNSRLSYKKRNHEPYSDEERSLYEQRVALRESSETMSIPRVAKAMREDIVQPTT